MNFFCSHPPFKTQFVMIHTSYYAYALMKENLMCTAKKCDRTTGPVLSDEASLAKQLKIQFLMFTVLVDFIALSLISGFQCFDDHLVRSTYT